MKQTRRNDSRDDSHDLLSPMQVADILCCGRTFVYELLAEPNPAIPSLKIGRLRRIRRVDVELYIQSRLEESQP